MYEAAGILRKKMIKSKRWFFEVSLPIVMKEVIPEEVQAFCKWCIKGKCDISNTAEVQHKDIEKKTEVLSQLLMSSCLTERQLKKCQIYNSITCVKHLYKLRLVLLFMVRLEIR